MDGLRSFNASLGFRHLNARPRLGDGFAIRGDVASVALKRSRRLGEFALVRGDVAIATRSGVPVATGYGTSIVYDLDGVGDTSTPPPSPREADGSRSPAVPPAEALHAVRRRGATPRYGRDVEPGTEIDPLFKGTLDAAEIAAFSVRRGEDPRADTAITEAWRLLLDGRGVEAARLYREIATDFGFGVARHLDRDQAASEGAPGGYDIGTQRAAWAAQAVTDWTGDAGTLVAIDVELRGFLTLGDDAWCRGVVTDNRPTGDRSLLALDVWVENQRAQRVLTGTAEVLLRRGPN